MKVLTDKKASSLEFNDKQDYREVGLVERMNSYYKK
jgi:hypothetical protein